MTIAEEAKYRIDKQCEKGLSKYGHLLDNAGCDERELIDHALEEVADLFQYLIALRRKIDRNTKITPPDELRAHPLTEEDCTKIEDKDYRDGKGY